MCRSDRPTQSRIVATTAETCRVKSASSLTWIKAEHSKLIQMAPMTNRASFDSFARSTFGIEPGSPIGARLESLATRMELPKGDSADLEKDADQIVFIGRGATKLVLHASNDREQIVAFHFVGDIVSVPAERHFASSLTSISDSELLVFPAREFFDHAVGDARVSRSLLDRLPAALHRCRDRAVALGKGTALERLSGFFLVMAERIGRTEGNRSELDLPMSRREIGESLGLTIETVSRQFGVLRELGLIETSGRSKVTLLKLDSLSEHAGYFQQTTNYSVSPQNLISINVGVEQLA